MPVRSLRPSLFAAGLAAWLLVPSGTVAPAELKLETVEAWNRYVAATEQRIDRELGSADGFLVLDFQAADRARSNRQALARGEIVIDEATTRDAEGDEIDVPSGSIQHWRGAVLVGGLSMDDMIAALESADTLRGQKDVVDWRVLERGPGWMLVFLRLRRESIVTVTYDTEHLVTITRVADDRATNRSVATCIAEIQEPGTPNERARPPGNDRGFLWRLNAYWRYLETPDGVIAEVESLSLSRSVPLVVRPLGVGLIVNRIARGSVESTLTGLRANLGRPRPPR